MTKDVGELMRIARELIASTRFCVAITASADDEINARVVQPSPPTDDWRVGFFSPRASRKVRELEQSGRLVLTYQCDQHSAHVTLQGDPAIVEDANTKRSTWTDDTGKWFPGGPDDPDVLLITLAVKRIELWSAAHKVWPAASSAALVLDGADWRYGVT